MGRAPCCEKMGLKKGPWTPEEDQILISYIQEHGHGNWRALPKQAGLLRCGKSCRLRWINYLRPDIKRGNFTKEEEETIINLHQLLGNRWSAIAARLPGRTDNEIKNVWHTHIKKRLENYKPPQPTKRQSSTMASKVSKTTKTSIVSPQDSCSEISTITDSSALNMDSSDYFPQIDESFWSEETSSSVTDDSSAKNNLSNDDDDQMVMIKNEEMDSSVYIRQNADQSSWFQKQHKDDSNNQSDFQEDSKFEIFPSSNTIASSSMEGENVCVSSNEEDKDFWFNLFIRAEDLPELPEF